MCCILVAFSKMTRVMFTEYEKTRWQKGRTDGITDVHQFLSEMAQSKKLTLYHGCHPVL